jgi:hypothetical protein
MPPCSSQLDSAPGQYSHYWAYSPCAVHHKLLLIKSCFLSLNKFVNILNTQVSHSARRTRLTPLTLEVKPLSQTMECFHPVWTNSRSVDSTFKACICTVWSSTISGKSPNRQVQAYLNAAEWIILERNGNPPLQIPCFGLRFIYLGRGVQGLWLATFLPVQRGAELARLSPREPSPTGTVTLGCPRWG